MGFGRLRMRQEEQAVNDAGKLGKLFQAGFQSLTVFLAGAGAAEGDLRLAPKIVERSSQFVRQFRRKLRQASERLLDVIQHGVQGNRESVEFGRQARQVQPLLEIRGPDPARRFLHGPDGPGSAARDVKTSQNGKQERGSQDYRKLFAKPRLHIQIARAIEGHFDDKGFRR